MAPWNPQDLFKQQTTKKHMQIINKHIFLHECLWNQIDYYRMPARDITCAKGYRHLVALRSILWYFCTGVIDGDGRSRLATGVAPVFHEIGTHDKTLEIFVFKNATFLCHHWRLKFSRGLQGDPAYDPDRFRNSA